MYSAFSKKGTIQGGDIIYGNMVCTLKWYSITTVSTLSNRLEKAKKNP